MKRYAIGGRSANTAATANHVAAQLWNASASRSLLVREVWCFKTAATADNHALVRTSARGTAGSTVTLGADNAFDREITPATGAALDLAAFSVQPTVAGNPLARANLPAAVGAGFIWVFAEAIKVPAGTGLAIATPVAVILQASDFTFVFDD